MKKGILLFSVLFLGMILTSSVGDVTATDKPSTTFSNNHHYIQYKNSKSTGTNPVLSGSAKAQTIKVLIYNGKNANQLSVSQIKSALATSNTKNLVPGYYFTYQTSTIINSASLQTYQVLVMPGGNGLYITPDGKTVDSISVPAIKNFISSGKGYVGICAGAYCGTTNIKDYYPGWGVAPHVSCKGVGYVGRLTLQITSQGQQIFRSGGIITTQHVNGPILYPTTGSVILAKYADNIIASKGLAAIVGDYYGKGRSVLCGPHPEFDPKHPNIVANSIAWAANLPKIPPKIISTVPTHLKTGVSRSSITTIKFSSNITASTYFNSITMKNLSTNKYIATTKTISKNILILKTGIKTSHTWYSVTIPAKSVKDLAGTNLGTNYSFRFKTGA